MPWIYGHARHRFISDVVANAHADSLDKCIYCQGPIVRFPFIDAPVINDDPRYESAHIEVIRCSMCGWWHVYKAYYKRNCHTDYYCAYGLLRPLDLSVIATPLEEVRGYLVAKYESRFGINPYLFEQTVASVFRDNGYRARVTNRSGDWGIDVYLDGPNDSLIGVQVKRWKDAIAVEQITALTGALVINDCTKGIFVTTSRFQPGAVEAAMRSSNRGFPIDLMDAARFYEILQIAQTKVTIDVSDPSMPWNLIEPECDAGTN